MAFSFPKSKQSGLKVGNGLWTPGSVKSLKCQYDEYDKEFIKDGCNYCSVAQKTQVELPNSNVF